MHPLLLAIRDAPLTYLPEPSLESFRHFRLGYLLRAGMEGQPLNLGFDGHKFHHWLRAHFQLKGGRAIADTTIVASFSSSEDGAFKEYFNLLEEFLETGGEEKTYPPRPTEKLTFVETVRRMRKQPALYIGWVTFLGCSSFLMGDERCSQDLDLPFDEGRKIFRDFQKWVESEQNDSSQHRPWFKVIQFWSGGCDSGSERLGAFSLFYTWLDQFCRTIGKDGLFSA